MQSHITFSMMMSFLLLLLLTHKGFSDDGSLRIIRPAKTLHATGDVHRMMKSQYAGTPSHREIALRAFELAVQAGFLDTIGVSHQEIQDRLEAGAYSEDYDLIPGLVGEHYPNPWVQGPDFDFYGLYPFTKIPYGSIVDKASGWFRGLPHGYDPVQGFTWPGTESTTVAWANARINAFSWDNALALYHEGKKAEAYECIGHTIHLLSDLSVPEHVKIINHGMSVTAENSGTILNPDLVTFIVDEYELALAGGVELPNVIKLIPDLLGYFRTALSTAKTANIPRLSSWRDYLVNLATYTYNDSIVNRFFSAPSANGQWGIFKNQHGETVEPVQYGITPPTLVADRWIQIVLKSTANVNDGTIIPDSVMIAMCNNLVPKAVEYCAGLLLQFLEEARKPSADVGNEDIVPRQILLLQNYPNPFNPSTKIGFDIPAKSFVSLKICNILGQEVATLVDEQKEVGRYEVTWDASNLPGGVYFYRLKAGDFIGVKKLMVIK